jgi:hypothetical protein
MRTHRLGRVIAARLEIKLTGEDYERWREAADRQALTLEHLVRESVELAIARGSTR